MQLTNGQLFPFYISAILLVASIFFYRKEDVRKALWLLFAGSILIGFGMSRLDPFLCLWDEQYHALVAKHLMNDPLKPMLYADPLYRYDISDWTSNHIWLHKPPLFLWQIAVSLKIFGTTALAVRLPSILLHALTALLVFFIGKRTVNTHAGFFGALFFACAYYPLELMAGKYATDHNDTAFMFYVTASTAAWMEYESTGKKRWWMIVGLMAGCAVLVKWLAGLLIFGMWFLSIGAEDRNRWRIFSSFKPLISAIAVAISVALPWYLYTFSRFPQEAAAAFAAHARHLVTPVEGHGGDLLFHFRALGALYGGGVLVPFIVVGGFIWLLLNIESKKFRYGLLSGVLAIYFIYSIAATKMVSFGTVVAPLFYLGLGTLAASAFSFLEKKITSRRILDVSVISVSLVICVLLWKPEKVERYHSFRHPEDNFSREKDLKQMRLIHRLENIVGRSTIALFNADIREQGHIACMFYVDVAAYGMIPDAQQLQKAKDLYGTVVVVEDDRLPERIKIDPEILLIKID